VVSRRTVAVVVVYGTLAAGALAWSGWSSLDGAASLFVHPSPWLTLHPAIAAAVSAALGVGLALLVVFLSRVLVRRTLWARNLHLAFRDVLGPMPSSTILAYAVASGVAEELFFRGAMQAAVGLVPAAIVFGLLHVGPSRRFVPWTVTAVVMGFVLGALYSLTGSLVGPILAHVVINYENMHFIVAFDPAPRKRKRSDPSLVGARERAAGRVPAA